MLLLVSGLIKLWSKRKVNRLRLTKNKRNTRVICPINFEAQDYAWKHLTKKIYYLTIEIKISLVLEKYWLTNLKK